MRLFRLLLPREQIEQTLADATHLSHTFSTDPDPLYKLLDPLYDYPSFLFHDSPGDRVLREEFGADYRHSLDLLLRSGFGTRNLGRRLRAFRMQHDLTQQEVADLLGLSDTHVAALEAGSRRASPRVRFKILRLLTLPLDSVHLRSSAVPTKRQRSQWLDLAKLLLSRPPPLPSDLSSVASAKEEASGAGGPTSSDTTDALQRRSSSRADAREYLERLRLFWLTSSRSTRQLAADLGIGQPHLIRLLRGDRAPSRKLRERIQTLTGHQSPATDHRLSAILPALSKRSVHPVGAERRSRA